MYRYFLLAIVLLIGCVQPYVPTPKPVDPDVVVPDEETTVGPFRVLYIEETDTHRKWPQSQLNVRTSGRLDDFYSSNNVTYRLCDNDDPLDSEGDKWFVKSLKDWNKTHTDEDTPWVIIEHGSKKTSEPLPKTVTETLQLLEKFK